MFIPICILNEIDSTNKEAKKIIQNNSTLNNFALFAKTQTAGVGKMGAKWSSGLGNVHLSVVLKKGLWFKDFSNISLISLSVALAIKNTLEPLLNNTATLQLKWPNDVLINNAKISGCLIEIEEDFLIIGVGINVVYAPVLDKYKTIYLNLIATKNIDSINLSSIFIKELFLILQNLSDSKNIINSYLKYCNNLHKKIQIKTNNTVIEGIFTGLNNKGFLQLQTQNELLEISSGEVF